MYSGPPAGTLEISGASAKQGQFQTLSRLTTAVSQK
jgi:hypothetical protein